jgi:uncharacterized metal-binding protein
MKDQEQNVCCGGPKLIFACSGAADVGAVADRAARRLAEEGAGSMFCLAGVGGRITPIMQKTQTASEILAIDGCPLNCVAETLQQAGFSRFKHLRITDLGFEKGSTPVDEKRIGKAVDQGRELLSV